MVVVLMHVGYIMVIVLLLAYLLCILMIVVLLHMLRNGCSADAYRIYNGYSTAIGIFVIYNDCSIVAYRLCNGCSTDLMQCRL